MLRSSVAAAASVSTEIDPGVPGEAVPGVKTPPEITKDFTGNPFVVVDVIRIYTPSCALLPGVPSGGYSMEEFNTVAAELDFDITFATSSEIVTISTPGNISSDLTDHVINFTVNVFSYND